LVNEYLWSPNLVYWKRSYQKCSCPHGASNLVKRDEDVCGRPQIYLLILNMRKPRFRENTCLSKGKKQLAMVS
jgi:hypothetical protein